MMGRQRGFQSKLFYVNINLEKRVPPDHILRKIHEAIDFDFIYREVKDTYGVNGNVSVPPPVILKMMVLLLLYNVRSERELIDAIPLRIDWLWFLGYDLDSEIPHHSVLSKARSRWGVKAFKLFFERIVWQCVEAGLVDGTKLFTDASLIDADASNNSVVDTQSVKKYLKKTYRQLEKRLEERRVSKRTPANSRFISTTDPDATVTRHSSGRSKLRYKTHRAVDQNHEVITATTITPGSVDDGEMLEETIDRHEANTTKSIDTVVADSRYGTIDTYLTCLDRGIKASIPSLEKTQRASGRKKGIFPKKAFHYDAASDTFRCPAGHILKRRNYYKKRNHYEYKAAADICAACELRDSCTRSKDGRTVKRHARQDELDAMLGHTTTREAKRDIKTRQHLSERSFGRSTRYGFKRARWRGLWRVAIQDFLTCAIQNIMVIVAHSERKVSKSTAQEGHGFHPQRSLWEKCSFGSLLTRFLNQFTLAFGVA
jgi:transposase